MAPLSSYIAAAMYDIKLEPRGLGGNHSSTAVEFTPREGNILQVLALVFSTISVASSILAFYWFIKMRRSFRHDLIMLLIQSDMFKALWFMIYPIVEFARGPIAGSSRFCQVNGFFISLGIEASDFAVLMVAVHTAIYIFKPGAAAGEGGLYPYRNYAYFLWIVFPLLMASLAFINNEQAYVSEGTYCYLPVRPFWYRLALGWIPRYLIFVIILSIYASIYYYVRYKFHGFDKEGVSEPSSNEDATETANRPPKRVKRNTLPPTPTLACHGLIPESRQVSMPVQAMRRESTATVTRYKPERSKSISGAHRFMLAASFAGGEQSCPTPPSEPSIVDVDSFTGPSTPEPISPLPPSIPQSPFANGSLSSAMPSDSRKTSWRDGFVNRFSPPHSGNTTQKHSIVDIFSILRSHPDDQAPTPISQLQLLNSRGQTYADAEMLRTRDKIRRQLRFLFIYPLVYIGMWILPFVSHVMQYKDNYASNPPFPLTCVTTISVCVQAAVDCWLFSTREKPWRHIPGTHGGFWESLKFWSGWKGLRKRRVVHGPGKTREEMVREARAAYKRRDQELAQRKTQAECPQPEGVTRRSERSWWEATGMDGPADSMSPVAEEISNPMDDIITCPDNEKAGEKEAVHAESIMRNQQIKWDLGDPASEPVSPLSAKGSSST